MLVFNLGQFNRCLTNNNIIRINISKLILGLSFQGIPGIAGPKGFMGLCGCDGEKVRMINISL